MKYAPVLLLLTITAAADDFDEMGRAARDPKADFHERTAAVRKLREAGAVEPLIELLNDPTISWAAADALGDVGRDAAKAVPALAKLAAVVDENRINSFTADQALEAIGKIGVGSREALQAVATRMSKKRDGEAALILTKLGEPGAEELFRLAVLYSNDKRPESERRFGEAYSIVSWGAPPFPPDRIPLLEKYLKQKGTNGFLASRALAAIGDPAKETVLSYLGSTDRELRVMAAETLSSMNWFAEREREHRKATTPNPVPDDEFFRKVVPLLADSGDDLDWRLWQVLLAADVERAMKVPVVAAMWKKNDLERQLKEYAEKRQRKYTVYVYAMVSGQWVRQDGRTFLGDEATGRKYEEYINAFNPGVWLATSNLPRYPTPESR